MGLMGLMGPMGLGRLISPIRGHALTVEHEDEHEHEDDYKPRPPYPVTTRSLYTPGCTTFTSPVLFSNRTSPIISTPSENRQSPFTASERLPTSDGTPAATSSSSWSTSLYSSDNSTFGGMRSEEHTSELHARQYLVCRLLL